MRLDKTALAIFLAIAMTGTSTAKVKGSSSSASSGRSRLFGKSGKHGHPKSTKIYGSCEQGTTTFSCDGAGCTATGDIECITTVAQCPTPLISKIEPNPPGTDPATQQLELCGPPGDSFNGTIVSIEADNFVAVGEIDRFSDVSGTFDANGLFVVNIGDLENPSFTLALVDGFTGSLGVVVDPMSPPWNNTFDAIGVPDIGEARLLGEELGGEDFAYGSGSEPRLIFRDGKTLEWFAIKPDNNLYDKSGTLITLEACGSLKDPTFGSPNLSQSDLPSGDKIVDVTLSDPSGQFDRNEGDDLSCEKVDDSKFDCTLTGAGSGTTAITVLYSCCDAGS